jgi:hypothetical protein
MEAGPDREPDNGSGKGEISGQSPAASGSVAVASTSATSHLSSTLGPLFTVVIGAVLIGVL